MIFTIYYNFFLNVIPHKMLVFHSVMYVFFSLFVCIDTEYAVLEPLDA